jgi:hypothetical protein
MPIATQVPGAKQLTLVRLLEVAPDGPEVDWTVQLLPFHDSTRVLEMPGPVLYVPTAVHELAEAQLTASRLLDSAPAGLGLLSTAQDEPSQLSIRATSVPARSTNSPTAKHAVVDVHVSPLRALP